MTPHDLIAAFETLLEAPGGVQRLRELVLQLAVRGKLVAQDPGDEPAMVLLERVARERRTRGGSGSKAPNIETSLMPFEVPPTWAWVRFGDVFECRLGKMLDKAKNRGALRPYLRNANVRWGSVDFTDVLEMRLEDQEIEDVTLSTGDLVICEGGEPGRCAVWRESHGFVIQKALHRARPYLVDSDYYQLHLRLDCSSGRIDELFTGATIKHLTGRMLDGHLVTLPPLAEQHRIVARVDELMGLLDRLETARNARDATRAALRDAALAALRNADTPDEVEVAWLRIAERMDDLFTDPTDVNPLRQAVLQLAVRGKLVRQDPADEPASVLLDRIAAQKALFVKEGKIRKSEQLLPVSEDEVPFQVPSGWRWSRFADVCDVRDGTHDTPKYVTDGVPLVTSKNLSSGVLDLSNVNMISRSDHAEISKRSRVDRGDILFAMIGSIGNPVAVDTDAHFSIKNVALFKPYGLRYLDFNYFLNYLRLAAGWMADAAGGGVQKFVALGKLRSYPVPVPPLAEQHRIVAKVDELMTLLDRLEERLKAQRDLQDAFAAAAVHHLDA